jgi:hypothetical protein
MPPGWLLLSSSLLRDSGGLRLRNLRGSLEHGALISLLVTTVTVAALLLLRSCSANSEGRGGGGGACFCGNDQLNIVLRESWSYIRCYCFAVLM